MARRKNAELARDERKWKTARLYLQGYSQRQIGEILNASATVVSRDVREVQAIWRANAVQALEKRLQLELAKIDLLEQEAWIAWEASKGTETSETTVTSRASKSKQATTRTSKTTKGTPGNPVFLKQIAWCVQQRCKLLGLYPDSDKLGAPPPPAPPGGAPQAVGMIDVSAVVDDMPRDQLLALVSIGIRMGVAVEGSSPTLAELQQEQTIDGSTSGPSVTASEPADPGGDSSGGS